MEYRVIVIKVIYPLVLCLSLTSCTPSQPVLQTAPATTNVDDSVQVDAAPTSSLQNTNLFVEVKSKTDWPSFRVEFKIGGNEYVINDNGRGKRTDSNGKPRIIDLSLDKDESLERLIYYATYGNDLLLICESSFADGGAGFIARLDGRTLRLKWKRHIPAFNVGQGLVHHNFAYVSAIGFVGKVNLESGVLVWKYDDLYGQEDSAFNSFEAPAINGNIIRFTESETHLRKTLASIDVDIETGKVVTIER